jgi:GTP-binding protein EngB required for normal cell division
LAGLDSALAQALRGQRQVVFVTGKAGIGKTTLVDVFHQRAASHPNLRIGDTDFSLHSLIIHRNFTIFFMTCGPGYGYSKARDGEEEKRKSFGGRRFATLFSHE